MNAEIWQILVCVAVGTVGEHERRRATSVLRNPELQLSQQRPIDRAAGGMRRSEMNDLRRVGRPGALSRRALDLIGGSVRHANERRAARPLGSAESRRAGELVSELQARRERIANRYAREIRRAFGEK